MSIMYSIKIAYFDLGKTLVVGNREWIPRAQETLHKFHKKGIRLGVISNTGRLTRTEVLDLLPQDFDLNLFGKELLMFSSEVSIEKPDSNIFRIAIERAGEKPSACLFCTEEEPHIRAAQKAGMQTALVQEPPNSDIGTLFDRLSS